MSMEYNINRFVAYWSQLKCIDLDQINIFKGAHTVAVLF